MRIPGLTARRASPIVRWLAARSGTRRMLNRLYGSTSLEQKARAHTRFAKVFREYKGPFESGEWLVEFAGKTIRIPLSAERPWLMWDLALSVVGHEPEIKQSYQTILAMRPKTVLDVGTNYGTHSLLFLVHGVRTISFEPNPHCHTAIEELCRANGVLPAIEPVAVGASEATIDLWFPEREEWLGTTDPATRDALQARSSLKRLTVPLTTVDAYVETHELKPDLIKIDTEGSDLQVLQGARRTLARDRPIVLFECWKPQRAGPDELFRAAAYEICSLPLTAARPLVLAAAEFASAEAANFGAIPRERLETWAH